MNFLKNHKNAIFKKIKKFKYLAKKLLCFFNTIFFFINLILLYFKFRTFTNYYPKIFKYSDIFNVDLYKQAYFKISNYLAEKYNCNSIKNVIKKHKYKKVIKLNILGHYNIMENWLINSLSDDFIITIDKSEPDYLIYNVYNNEDMNPIYSIINPVRIAFFTENVMADLNYADYILGPFHINYLDRFFNFATFLIKNFSDIEQIRKNSIKKKKKKFCAAVISNCNAKFRLNFIRKLSKYKIVDMGGKCKNNINHSVENKIKFLEDYKFSMAMENSNGDGYLSEKIVDSFRAGTIPIYYGGYLVDEFINPKSYILIKGEKDINEKIEYIKNIDQNDDIYKSLMKEKPLIDKNFQNIIYKKEIILFLKNIFQQDKNKAYRRDNNYYDYYCEKSIS